MPAMPEIIKLFQKIFPETDHPKHQTSDTKKQRAITDIDQNY